MSKQSCLSFFEVNQSWYDKYDKYDVYHRFRPAHSLTKESRSHSMGNRVGEDGGVGNKRGVGNNLLDNRDSLGVGSSTFIADLRDKAIIVVGTVVDSLDTAVRKVDRVRSLNNTISIIGLSLVESSSRVVVSDSILEVVGGDLSKVRGGISCSLHDRGVVGRGSMDNRGSISWGSVDNGSSIGGSSVHKRGSWVSNGVSDRVGNDSPGSVKSVGRVRD